METTRQKKVARLLQKELGEIFQRESNTMFGGAFITVTGVRISPDLSVAKTYLSIFVVKDRDLVMKNVKKQTKEIRTKLGERIKQQLRIVPNLDFHIDDSLDYAEKIDNLLKK
ncbi:MAG: 30S ribosome-binding factor RbfA [Bacteroidetes bacterium]|nr:30S ribosome-binding factor RbfA [Bacteroidota bacterium]HET6242969.1 30S ribosome-binding factor RbfA [Bacteroidia bacterium]